MNTRSARELTKLARIPLFLLDYAEQQGLDRAVLMDASSLTEHDLEDPDSRIHLRIVIRLWREIIERLDEPTLGLSVGRSITAIRLGLVGYAMQNSADLLEAVRCLARYYRILSEAVWFDITQDDARTTLTYSAHPMLTALRHPIEAPVAALVTVARELSNQPIVPIKVELPFPKHGSPQSFHSAFGVQPRFDSVATAIVFSNEQMKLPVAGSDPTLGGYLTKLAEITLQSMRSPEHDFAQQVRETLWAMLPQGKPDLWRTAKRMSISPRTLQRRLREEGSSFSSVLEDLRRGLSEELLADRKLAIAEVAFLLGYSEPSAFQRAFRRWHDTSPRSYGTR